MEWIGALLALLVIIVLPAIAAELMFGESDREAHRKAAAAQAKHKAELERVRNGEYGREVLGGLAGNGPRAMALYQSYSDGLDRRRHREDNPE